MPQQFAPVEANAPARARIRRQQPHHRHQRLTLARARFADDANALARIQRQRKIRDRLDVARRRGERHPEFAHLEQRTRAGMRSRSGIP